MLFSFNADGANILRYIDSTDIRPYGNFKGIRCGVQNCNQNNSYKISRNCYNFIPSG